MTHSTTIHIAILDTDIPVPSVLSKRGLYSDIFTNILQEALQRINNTSLPPRQIHFKTEAYETQKGEYPPDPEILDAILITGSAAASYDSTPWVQELDRYVSDIYSRFRHIKFFGSCFGHQLICQSLLRESGVIVELHPNGYELGVHPVELSPEFLASFPGKVEDLPSFKAIKRGSSGLPLARTQFIHRDHVLIAPEKAKLPEGWSVFGSTPHCHVQGILQKRRVLTYQGHFEFDRFINSETIKVFGKNWEPEAMKAALENADNDDDADFLAEIVAAFFVDGKPVEAVSGGGLVTPPEEN